MISLISVSRVCWSLRTAGAYHYSIIHSGIPSGQFTTTVRRWYPSGTAGQVLVHCVFYRNYSHTHTPFSKQVQLGLVTRELQTFTPVYEEQSPVSDAKALLSDESIDRRGVSYTQQPAFSSTSIDACPHLLFFLRSLGCLALSLFSRRITAPQACPHDLDRVLLQKDPIGTQNIIIVIHVVFYDMFSMNILSL